MMSQDNEYIQQLLAESRSGSREGMGCLAVAVRERLYPFVLRTTLDHDTTEDILQETLLSVILQVTSLRETPRFWPWVYRIAWNKTQDSFRRQYVRASDKTSAAWNQPQEVQNESLLEIKAYEETLQQVSDGLDQLSRHHRDVLRLRCPAAPLLRAVELRTNRVTHPHDTEGSPRPVLPRQETSQDSPARLLRIDKTNRAGLVPPLL
jgi:RNA polymerase sigma factor (sigma-70 family)